MIHHDDDAEKTLDRLAVLLQNINDPCFNDWERSFLRSLRDAKYSALSRHEKGVVMRLYNWWRGGGGDKPPEAA